MSKKLTPNVRFKGFSDDWEQRKLGQVASRVTRKNKNLESTLPLTISAQNGLVDQREFFDKVVASKNVSGYFLVKKGEFAYNKSYSKGYPVGAIKRLDKYSMGVLSTLYIVFTPEKVNSQFLATYYESTSWYREVIKVSAEGARNHGLLNISPNDFFSTKLEIPVNSKEQENIGEVISFIDEIIASNQKQLDQLKTLKKLFLQKIFDQEWRFKGFTDPWEQRKLVSMAKITTGKAFKSEDFSDEGRYLVITNKDILKVNTNCISGDRIDIDDSKIIDKYSLANPSVLITMDGVNIGKTGRYQNKFAVLAQRVGRLESDELNFVYQITQNDRFINTMKTLSVGNAIKHISLKQISEYVLSVPLEDSEKRRIGNLLTGLDQTITSNQKQLDQLKQLKKWFLQNLFV